MAATYRFSERAYIHSETRIWAFAFAIVVVLGAVISLPVSASAATSQPIYRLYNPNDGQHIFTPSVTEEGKLQLAGWNYEGIAWYSPTKSNTPVYRLYNPNNGDHLYTTKLSEYNGLVPRGWRQEGVQFYSDDAHGMAVYRLFNASNTYRGGVGSHHWTTSRNEYDQLPKTNPVGAWRQEEAAWYGMASGPSNRSVLSSMAGSYVMASGIGGWSSTFVMHSDGTFSGEYYDHSFGSLYPGCKDDYYVCECTGTFYDPIKIDNYTYRTSVAPIQYAKTPGTRERIGTSCYNYESFYGLANGRVVYLYLPGKPTSSIPSDCKSWFNAVRRNWLSSRTLPGYVIYNQTEGKALVS